MPIPHDLGACRTVILTRVWREIRRLAHSADGTVVVQAVGLPGKILRTEWCHEDAAALALWTAFFIARVMVSI
jgi:hypothetical protein